MKHTEEEAEEERLQGRLAVACCSEKNTTQAKTVTTLSKQGLAPRAVGLEDLQFES